MDLHNGGPFFFVSIAFYKAGRSYSAGIHEWVYLFAFLPFHYQRRIEFLAGSIYADLILNSLCTQVFYVAGKRNYFGNGLDGIQSIDIAFRKDLAVGSYNYN